MTNLDINTPRGQKSLVHEELMLNRIKKLRQVDIIETDKATAAAIDGFIVRENKITGVFESKCRNMSYEQLQQYGSWLVTYDKIIKGQAISKLLHVPFLGFLYLIQDMRILYWKITDSNGNFTFSYDVKQSQTQATINGGIAHRWNAFLPIKHAKEIL